MHNVYDNPLISRYASREMAELWSDQRKFGVWRRLWVALAEAEAELGLPVTAEQVAELRAHVDDIDFEAATPADVMALVQNGTLPIAPELQRLEVDSNDEAAVETLRAYCPSREGDEEIDMTVARQLLQEPGLYARALHRTPDTAASAAAVTPTSGS